MKLHKVTLKYDLPQLADDVSRTFDRRLAHLFENKNYPADFIVERIFNIAAVFYGMPDDECSSLLPGFLRAMRTHWANLIGANLVELRRCAITAIFDKYPRLAVDLLRSDPEHLRWSV